MQRFTAPGASGPQNVYDDPEFFEGYRSLRQHDTGLNGAVEIPAVRALVPDLRGRRVLDLGCGFGDFARHARLAGAASVIAVDISGNMLREAARLTDDPDITYRQSAIEDYRPERQSVDIVVSSLALHYVADYASIVARVFEALRPGGLFVFSVEHPVATAHPAGWVRGDKGNALHWPLDHYSEEGPRQTTWFIEGVVKYHRTVASYVNALIAGGFRIEHLGEPGPTPEALAARPQLAQEQRRPPFLLLSASRPT